MKNISDKWSLPFLQRSNIIYFSQDMYGRIIVIDDGEYRILNFGSLLEQSCMRKGRPYRLAHQYTQLMMLALAFIEPQHISLFGLGGGSLLRTLHYVLPSCLFHVVELRQKVVDIANQYFLLPNDHRVNITVNDALLEISNIKSNSSDILFSDMYDAYQMIPAQTQEMFLLDCSRVLTDRGWLVINLHHLPCNREAFFELLGSAFPTIILCTSEGSTILLVSNATPENVRSKIQRIEAIEGILQQPLSQFMPRLMPVNFRFVE